MPDSVKDQHKQNIADSQPLKDAGREAEASALAKPVKSSLLKENLQNPSKLISKDPTQAQIYVRMIKYIKP